MQDLWHQRLRNSANPQRIPSGTTANDGITRGKLEAGQRNFAHEKLHRKKIIEQQYPRHIAAESIRSTATPAPKTNQQLGIDARLDRLELGQPQCDWKHAKSVIHASTEQTSAANTPRNGHQWYAPKASAHTH